jgi:DNA polymerase III delta prime subunit
MAGVPSRFRTNSEAILGHADRLFLRLPSPSLDPGLTLRLWVSREDTPSFADPKPCYRGLGQFVFAGFEGDNFLIVDLARRLVAGRFSPRFAGDEATWRKIVFPVLLAMAAPSVGASVLHCASVERDQRGLILAGPSGSGKSTLSLALGQLGFGLVSDDRTCFSLRNERLLGWGMGGYWKLRADAHGHFPGLRSVSPARVTAEGPVFEIDPEETLGLKLSKCCEPEWLVFLERREDKIFELTPMSSSEAAARLEDGLPEETVEGIDRQRAMIGELVSRPCRRLSYGGSPSAAAQFLAEKLCSARPADLKPSTPHFVLAASPQKQREDPLRRFTPLPYKMSLSVMGRRGDLETNSLQVMECARRLFRDETPPGMNTANFRWRIAAEDGPAVEDPWPPPVAFSSEGLRLSRLDQRSFIAVDTGTAEGVGILPTSRVEDGAGFAGIFLAALFYATAPALGLAPLSASCIAAGESALLLLGLPGNGKTTCAYAAGKLGLEYHSDMVTFLEVSQSGLLAYGEFWPALFRRETAQFLPELLFLGRALRHTTRTFISVDKSAVGKSSPRGVTPTMAMCLERGAADTPRLTRLSAVEFAEVLASSFPFEEEERFQAQRDAVRQALEKIPAYRLAYRQDPAEAAVFCKSLLRIHEGIGATR